MADYKWRFQRFYERTTENGKEFFEDFFFDIKEILIIPWDLTKDIFRYLKRVIDYSPLLFYDRDFDYTPILRFLQYKIKRTRDHINEHKLHNDYKRDVKNMDKAIALIDLCMDDYYHWEACMKPLEEKYGQNIRYTEDKILNSEEVLKRPYTSTFSKYEKENDSNKHQIQKEVRAAMNKSHKLHEKDWDNLFKLLRTELRGWWD